MAQPAHIAHLLASSPFHDAGSASPLDSPASEAPRFDFDDSLHSYSSPPSSVPSSANTSFSNAHQSFPTFHHQLCSDASYEGYNSSPLAGAPMYHFDSPQVHHMEPHHQQQQQQHILPYSVEDPYMMRPYQAPRAAMIPELAIDGVQRPSPKRRKTCPDLDSSPSKRACKEKRGNGKDGDHVWPEDVEIAFFESIRLVPKLGRKKITVNGKPCGRNELIGDYIRRKTGKIRSRKQVSSHIQVLKNIKRHDYEFMNYVAEPKAGEQEEDFAPEAHTLFFAPQEFAHVVAEDKPPSPPESSYGGYLSASLNSSIGRDGLLSPYCGGSFFSQGTSSGSSSPALSACSTRSLSPYTFGTPSGMSGDDLPQAVHAFQLKLAPPSPAMTASTPTGPVMAPLPPLPEDATPKVSPSKLGHRRAASRGLSLHIPANTFGQHVVADQGPIDGHMLMGGGQQHNASNPSTPWPQVIHTPTCPPPAPPLLASPTMRNRLPQIWANSSSDWNKASPALERSFEHELSAAVISSRNMQQAAARNSAGPLKRSYTDIPVSSSPASNGTRCPSEPLEMKEDFQHAQQQQQELELEQDVFAAPVKEDADSFFSSLLGSRDY